MSGCIFCKIAGGEIQAETIYKDDAILAFPDLKPKAPLHVVIIPRKHIEKISDVREGEITILGKMLFAATKIAREKNIESSGYRIVVNCGADAGQEIFHIHLHLLGGRRLSWPPG